MNRVIYGLSLGVLAFGIGGCATTSTGSLAGQTTQARAPQDGAYIAAVDQLAKRRGVRVIWVNAPRRSGDKVQISLPAFNVDGNDDSGAGTR